MTATTLNYENGAASGAGGADDVKSTFAYDSIGEQIGYCPANAVYGLACNPSSGTDTSAWHFSYNADGLVTVVTPPVNQTALADLDATVTAYDEGNRPSSVSSCTTSACSVVHRHTDTTYG